MFNYVRGFALRAWIFCLLVSRVSWGGSSCSRVGRTVCVCARVRVCARARSSLYRVVLRFDSTPLGLIVLLLSGQLASSYSIIVIPYRLPLDRDSTPVLEFLRSAQPTTYYLLGAIHERPSIVFRFIT